MYSGVVFNVWCVRIATRAFKVCRTILLFGLGAHSTNIHTKGAGYGIYTHTHTADWECAAPPLLLLSLSQPNIHWDKLNEKPADYIVCTARRRCQDDLTAWRKKAASAIWEYQLIVHSRAAPAERRGVFLRSVNRGAPHRLRRCLNRRNPTAQFWWLWVNNHLMHNLLHNYGSVSQMQPHFFVVIIFVIESLASDFSDRLLHFISRIYMHNWHKVCVFFFLIPQSKILLKYQNNNPAKCIAIIIPRA